MTLVYTQTYYSNFNPEAMMSSTRISSILRSISAPTTNAYARISVYIAASYDAARNVRIPRKRKQKKRKKDSSTQNREREEEKRNGGDGSLSSA